MKSHRMKSSERLLRETKMTHSNFTEGGKYSKAYRRNKEMKKQCFSNYNLHVIE